MTAAAPARSTRSSATATTAQSPWARSRNRARSTTTRRDAARGHEAAGVAHRDAERQPPALDRFEHGVRGDLPAHGRRREVGELDLVADGRRVRRQGGGDGFEARFLGERTTRGVPSTGTSPLCIASDVSLSATSNVTDPERPGFTPMAVR